MFNVDYIEFWEKEYLDQIEYLLNLDKDKMLEGFRTKEYIKDDWKMYLGRETSDFATGAERIFYWLFNQFGQPNSSPIGSDLFFETYNAYIHIDVKTVTLKNIGDYSTNIFIGNNQTSYDCKITTNSREEDYISNLPKYYTKKGVSSNISKLCLTYLITILYNENNFELLNLSIMCVPNKGLYDIYRDEVFKAGKNPGKARFNFSRISDFRVIGGKRVRSIIHKPHLYNYTGMTQESYNKKMAFWNNLNNNSPIN